MSRKATEKIIKKVVVQLDGKEWPILMTHNVLIECEELTGLNLLTGEVNLLRPSAKVVRALLFVCLKHAGAGYTLAQVGDLIQPNNIVSLQKAFLSAWTASIPEPEEIEKDPTKAA